MSVNREPNFLPRSVVKLGFLNARDVLFTTCQHSMFSFKQAWGAGLEEKTHLGHVAIGGVVVVGMVLLWFMCFVVFPGKILRDAFSIMCWLKLKFVYSEIRKGELMVTVY